MPYIGQKHREAVLRDGPTSPGELNFCITTACLRYSRAITPLSELQDAVMAACRVYTMRCGAMYSTFNDVVGALECSKFEITRRRDALKNDVNGSIQFALNTVKKVYYDDIVAPYEDAKIKENGDVF